MWELETGNEFARFKHNDEVWCSRFDSKGKRIITGSKDGDVKIFDLETKQLVTEFKYDGRVTAALFHPTKEQIIIGLGTGNIYIRDLNTEKTIKELIHQTQESKEVNYIVLNPEGDKILSTGETLAIVWDYQTGKLLKRFSYEKLIYRAIFDPSAKHVITASFDNTAKIWDLSTGIQMKEFTHKKFVTALAITKNGNQLVTGSMDGFAYIWKVYHPTLKQALLRKVMSDFLKSQNTKLFHGIEESTKLLKKVAKTFNLKEKELKEIWESLPKPVQESLWKSIYRVILKYDDSGMGGCFGTR